MLIQSFVSNLTMPVSSIKLTEQRNALPQKFDGGVSVRTKRQRDEPETGTQRGKKCTCCRGSGHSQKPAMSCVCLLHRAELSRAALHTCLSSSDTR